MVTSAAVDLPIGVTPIKLVSMQLSPQQSDDYAVPSSLDDAPQFPWGLCLTLNDDALAKLGIPLPNVSSTFTLVAKVEVVRAAATKKQDGAELSADLQITDMRLIDPNNAPDKAEKLWPSARPDAPQPAVTAAQTV
jgi:hypothetical protein